MADELDQDVPSEDVTPTTKAKKAPEPPVDEFDGLSLEEIRDRARKAEKAKQLANKEAAESRRRARELEEAEEKRKEQSLSEEERRKRELEQARREASERKAEAEKARNELMQVRLDRAIEEEAAKQGFTIPRQASALLKGDASFGPVEWNEEDKRAVGVREAVKKLGDEYPNLKSPGGMPRGGGTPPRDNGRPQAPPRAPGKDTEVVDKSEYDAAQLRQMYGRGAEVRF